jgi:hypothetical protein
MPDTQPKPKPKRKRPERRDDSTSKPPRRTRASSFVCAWLSVIDDDRPRSQTGLVSKLAAAGHKVSQVTISQIVNGRLSTTPRLPTMRAFEAVLGVPIERWLSAVEESDVVSTPADE